MKELDKPDLDLIKQENQGAGASATSAYILRGVREGRNQRGHFCC